MLSQKENRAIDSWSNLCSFAKLSSVWTLNDVEVDLLEMVNYTALEDDDLDWALQRIDSFISTEYQIIDNSFKYSRYKNNWIDLVDKVEKQERLCYQWYNYLKPENKRK